MGYMGFGMRKDNYKRKPRKSFTHFKALYGNDTPKVKHDPTAPTPTSDEILNKQRGQSIADSRVFQYIKLFLLLGTIAVMVHAVFIKPWLFRRNLEARQQALINSYSSDHEYLLNSNSQFDLHYFEFDSLHASYIIATKGIKRDVSITWSYAPYIVRVGHWYSNNFDVDINNNELKVMTGDSTLVFKDQWALLLRSDTTDAKFYKIANQLSLDLDKIDELRKRLKKIKAEKVASGYNNTSILLESTYEYGTYRFIKTKEALEENKYQKRIDDQVYFRRSN